MRRAWTRQPVRSGAAGRAAAGAIALACALAPASGCVTFRPDAVAVGAPAAHRLVVAPFILSTNYPLAENDPIVLELAALRRQLNEVLHLPVSSRPIEIYIFDNRASYERFLAAHYPELPNRRAYFIAQAQREVVYTFRGSRLDEDLRHEACHALVHASLSEVPLWLDEGLAEYFESPSDTHGLHARHLSDLKKAIAQGWRPGLTRLESLTEVRQMTAEDYRESWAWVYYLLHGSGDGRAVLLAYLNELASPPRREPLSARIFRTLSRPDAALVDYMARVEPALLSAER